MTTRAEHLQWAKDRAIECLKTGDVNNAFASFQSDMAKHKETKFHIYLPIFAAKFLGGMLNTPDAMRREIEGFN